MAKLNLGENYRIEENDDGHLVVRDRESGSIVATHDRDQDRWRFTASASGVVGLEDRSSAPDGEEGIRKLYANGSDGNVYRVDPDGSEQQVGGAGDLAGLSDVYKRSEEPSNPSDGDIWFVTDG